ncbi:(Fe-S)-binding protein [Candidatus Bathyarchaeota archaeon]|nr:(Fe-S)-binding protein [Candidatus Bathyarchaeota archaeon]
MSQQLHRFEEALRNCNRCGLCHGVSPLISVQGLESSTARGKIRLARSLIQGEIEATNTLVDRIYQCLMCGSCSNVCPAGIKVEEVICSARMRLASAGKVPQPVKSLVSNIVSRGNIYGVAVERSEPSQERLVYFPGCVSSLKYRQLADATISCLSGMGLRVSSLDGVCCGAPALAAGFKEVYEQASERLRSMLEGFDVVTGCPQCYYFLKRERISVQHIAQLYAEIMESRVLPPTGGLRDMITYADPCYLARFSSITDEPRAVISSIAGLRLVEMASNRTNAKCCGNGLELVQTSYPELAGEVASSRLGEALELGVKKVVTSCPHCYLTFKNTRRERGLPIVIKDLSQLIMEAYRWEPPAKRNRRI